MLDLNQLEEAGKNIEAKLVKIRESLSAPIGDYQIRPAGIEISAEKLREMALQSPGEPIIIDGLISMAYIRDHAFQGSKRDYQQDIDLHPARCFRFGNKVHFYRCLTLVQMITKGRKTRYQTESVFVNEHTIDISNSVTPSVRLALCKNCIDVFFNNARVHTLHSNDIKKLGEKYGDVKSRIAEYGDATKLKICIRSLYENDSSTKEKVGEFIRGI